jgi:hypothetical protein
MATTDMIEIVVGNIYYTESNWPEKEAPLRLLKTGSAGEKGPI